MEEELLFYAGVLLLAYFVFKFFFSKKGLIAFDLGGVFTKGDYFTERISEREGMRALIKELKRNYRVALLSNQNSDAHSVFEKKFGLTDLFDEQIVSGRVGVKKPDQKIFQVLLNNSKAKPQETVFIDDDAANVEAAKKLGIIGIQFVSLQQLVNDFKRIGIRV